MNKHLPLLPGSSKTQSAGREYGKHLLKSAAVLGIGIAGFLSQELSAQTAPSSFSVFTERPASVQYEYNGYGSTSDYSIWNNYNNRFGRSSATEAGANRKVSSFVIGTTEYFPLDIGSFDKPFSRVKLNRVENDQVSDLGKQSLFFENSGESDGFDNTYHIPDYAEDMETAINSFIFNRGSDNVFSNASGTTLNNIERIDLIRDDYTMLNIDPTRNDVGFMIMERGGNDAFKVAAITSLDAAGNPASFGPLISVSTGDWGSTGVSITSTVYMKNSGDTHLRPAQHITAQSIYGVFISLGDLDVPADGIIYGISLFAGDVVETMDLIGLSDVPLNSHATGAGGLDFMAGGGFFVKNPEEFLKSLAGNVFHDGNGLTDMLPTGEGIGNIDGYPLYAYLLDESGSVLKKTPVSAEGAFDFGPSLQKEMVYSVRISVNDMSVGDMAPVNPTLPHGWMPVWDSYYNNENGYTNPLKNTGYMPDYTEYTIIEDGSSVSRYIQNGRPDLTISVMDDDFPEIRVQFGIQKAPEADAKEFMIEHTAFNTTTPVEGYPYISGYQSIKMNNPAFAGPDAVLQGSLSGTDLEDCDLRSSCVTGRTFIIFAINDNTRLYYNHGGDVEEINLTSGPVTINDFDHENMVIYGLEGSGGVDDPIGFIYSLVDEADVTSPPVPYKIFTSSPLPVDLISFQLNASSASVILSWTTAEEHNNKGFQVERSQDGRSWTAIGFVNSQAADGESQSIIDYLFTDDAPYKGLNFYRLLQTDHDGQGKYSPVRSIDMGNNADIHVYPNPVTDILYINNLENNSEIHILDISGRTVHSIMNVSNAGHLSIDLSGYHHGVYFIKVINPADQGETITYKILKK